MDFHCVHTPYQIDPLFTTQCLAGQWNPHPRDICDHNLNVVGREDVVTTLVAVITLVFLAFIGTLLAFLIVIAKYKKGNLHNVCKVNVFF